MRSKSRTYVVLLDDYNFRQEIVMVPHRDQRKKRSSKPKKNATPEILPAVPPA